MSPYEQYLKAEHQINEGLIRRDLSLARPEGYGRDPAARMTTMRRFLAACGDPQRGLPAVHVTGTSGKGSVCAAVAGILSEAGLRVGMHVSPYLQAATEKIWIADRLIGAAQFAELVDWVTPVARPLVRPETPASPHGMASVAIALEAFRRANVDVIVFEAGCGARYDLTSFVETEVAVITNVGLDHVVSLGPTLEDIAWHKAGIARPGAPLITGATGGPLAVIEAEAAAVGAPLTVLPPSDHAFDHNRALAVAAAQQVAGRLGVELNDAQIAAGLGRAPLAGRSELMPEGGPRVVLDGAHNPEKLRVAVAAAAPRMGTGRRVLLAGFLGTKAGPALVRPLAGRFDAVVVTEPQVYAKAAYPAAAAARLLADTGYQPIAEPDPHRALELAIAAAGTAGAVLVTGSFYLVGAVRERWYPKRQVVLERTSWPDRSSGA